MALSSELLKIRGLGKVFPNGASRKVVLKGIDLEVGESDSLAVVGPSGCGKTTLLLMIAGLLAPTEGDILLEGEAVRGPTRKIALVLQEYGLFPWKTVGENISLGARLQKIRISGDKLSALKRDLGIEGLDALFPRQLSGGQRQRVALARALLLQPSLLLLDEPFAALDTITRERLQNHLLELFTRRRFSYIVVTHNIEEAIVLGRRILALDEKTGTPAALVDNPGAGEPAYRRDPLFFNRSMELQAILKEASWTNGH